MTGSGPYLPFAYRELDEREFPYAMLLLPALVTTRMDVSGIIPPMITPVEDRSGTVAVDELGRLTAHLVESGVDGVFPCGTTGEFTSLSRSARKKTIRTVVESADSTPVLAGCGSTNREETGALIEDAHQVGADAAVVVTPYYLPGTQEGLTEFYTDLADASRLPILVYHIPARTGQTLTARTVQKLAEHPKIVGIKDSSGDTSYLYELVRSTPESFSVLYGGVINTPTLLPMGVDGIVPGQANYMPEVLADVYEAFRTGDDAAMREALRDVNEISRLFREIPLIPAIKYLTNYAGFQVGPPLPPLSELEEGDKEALRSRFDHVRQ